MPAPVPKWYNPDDTVCAQWDAGIVDAQSYSAEKELYIWNNRGTVGTPTTDVSDMTNVYITTKNPADGSDNNPIAAKTSGYVEVSMHNGTEWSAWTQIGGSSSTAPIVSKTGVSGTLKGTGNNGNKTLEANLANFAHLKLRLYVLPDAPAGPVNWVTRVSYLYT